MRPIPQALQKDRGRSPAVDETRRRVITLLSEYLIHDFESDSPAFSRHNMLGPVGKLLIRMRSFRGQEPEAVMGPVLQIHAHSDRRGKLPKLEAMDKLQEAVRLLIDLRNQLGDDRLYLQTLTEIEHAVFTRKYRSVAERVADRQQETVTRRNRG